MRDLNNCLFDYHPAMLEVIAQNWDIELAVSDKREMISQLAEEMLQPAAVARILEILSAEERAALDEVIAARGSIKAAPFTRRRGEIRSFGPGSLRREQPWRAPVSPIEMLWYRGLIYKGFAKLDDYIGEVIFIPHDLLALLPDAALPPVTLQLNPVPAPAQTYTLFLVKEIFSLLTYLQRENVHPTTDGKLRKLARQAVLARMENKDELGFALGYYVATQMELLSIKDGVLKPSPEARRWLKASPEARLHAVRTTWRDSDWDELCHIAALQCESADKRQVDARETRHNFLNLLAQCPAQEWLSIADLIDAVKMNAPDFQRSDGNYKTWYIRDIAEDKYLVGFEHWEDVEGRLIRHFVTQPLAWLGIVELSRGVDTASAFRITASGEQFLKGAEISASPATSPPLTIREDFTITIPDEFDLYDHFQLERLANRMTEDRADSYSLSRDRVAAILQQDVKVENILTFLRRVSEDRVPATIVQNLRQWAAKYEAVMLERVILLRTWDAMTMQELRAAPPLQPYLGAQVDESSIIVATDDIDKVTALLQELGYWARIQPCEPETT